MREQGRNPKEIARILEIRPAEASQLVRAAAALAQDAAPEPALAGCWISPGWSTGLDIGDHPGWPVDDDPAEGSQGLISVLVARRVRYGKVSACGYLADAYCLGVKNALGPEPMGERGLGFDPHPDFAAAAGHLGSWIGPGAISFGKDGKPLYVFGPYDDHRSVVRTLKRTVGRGNFEVLAITG